MTNSNKPPLVARPVTKALIPAAGRGTRMAPFSQVVAKELVPIGATPVLQLILEEIAAAGLQEVGIVIRPGKGALIERFVDQLHQREPRPGAADLRQLEIRWIEQPEPRGLGDAILCAEPFLGGDSFALLLPDNLLLGEDHRLGDLVRLHERTGRDVIGVLELSHESSGEYGNCGLIDYVVERPEEPRVLTLQRLHDKLPGRLHVAVGEVKRRTCGRYVCTPHLLTELLALRRQLEVAESADELDEVPAYQRVILKQGAHGWVLSGPVFDVGYPLGYLAACAYEYARQRSRWTPGD
jgi:UTP--glucose-1-phosphate uridylyltransferase